MCADDVHRIDKTHVARPPRINKCVDAFLRHGAWRTECPVHRVPSAPSARALRILGRAFFGGEGCVGVAWEFAFGENALRKGGR